MLIYLKHVLWNILFDEAAAKSRWAATLGFLGYLFKSGGVVALVPGVPEFVVPGLTAPIFQTIGGWLLLGAFLVAGSSSQIWRDAAAARNASTKKDPPAASP